MINTLDILDVLYTRLKSSAVDTDANGGLFKNARPQGSVKEDIVINCLPVSNDMLQLATANVNIYVPDLFLKIGAIEGVDQYIPNISRLQTLAGLAITILKNVNLPNYFYDIVSQGIIREPEGNQHFVNIRIEFKNINL